jgi:hypothetical protein
VNLCLPFKEVNDYKADILKSAKNSWNMVRNINADGCEIINFLQKDLHIEIRICKKHSEDIIENRIIPEDYQSIDIKINSSGFFLNKEFCKRPWNVLKTGFRKKDKRENPIIDNVINRIVELLPAQIELGCGPSVEAGIPPLNKLHEIYGITNLQTKKYIFSHSTNDLVLEIISNPENAYRRMTEMYKKCFLAQPTKFHKILKKLFDKKLIVGSIITNNFDGLVKKVGLKETYIRRFESDHIIPKIDFHTNAKSLIVVGSHADRRKIHHAARKKGLKIIYIDPEGYYKNKEFEPYLLEDPQKCDILFKETASVAFEKIYKKIINNLK